MNRLAQLICFVVLVLGGSYYHADAQVPTTSFRTTQSRGTGRLATVKRDYLNKQLNLTPTESKKFWPLYKQYQEQMRTIRKLRAQNSSASPTNPNDAINKDLYYETQLVETRKRYNDEFLKILPAEKVNELYKSERDFNSEVIRQLSERSERAGN
jgi:hypothetical protein